MIPHKLKIKIIEALILPDTLKETKSIWGRELKLLKQIADTQYDDPQFWLTLKLGYQLHSFAFFKGERGSLELETAWRQFKSQKALDTESKSDNLALSKEIEAPAQKPVETPANWADSL